MYLEARREERRLAGTTGIGGEGARGSGLSALWCAAGSEWNDRIGDAVVGAVEDAADRTGEIHDRVGLTTL